jgi:hypothetical protein
MDENKLMQIVIQAVGDFGSLLTGALVVLGDRLGLYRTLAAAGRPITTAELAASALVCTPASLSQEVGAALGAQASEARLREVVTAGGFTSFRRAAETPFNLVLEARP